MSDLVENVCVRLMDEENDEVVTAYYTSNLSETLKFYWAVAELGISVYADIDDADGDGHSVECFIDDIDVTFADGEHVFSINLYCQVS